MCLSSQVMSSDQPTLMISTNSRYGTDLDTFKLFDSFRVFSYEYDAGVIKKLNVRVRGESERWLEM